MQARTVTLGYAYLKNEAREWMHGKVSIGSTLNKISSNANSMHYVSHCYLHLQYVTCKLIRVALKHVRLI